MEDDIEDLVGEVHYTDSSKSIPTSLVYSYDFSDSSPERNNSSGKDTYVIECDETDSEDTENTYKLQLNKGNTNLVLEPQERKPSFNVSVQSEAIQVFNGHASTSYHKCSIIAHESFTQTSKTIFELAENDGLISNKKDTENLHTQTSFISITENKQIHYTYQLDNNDLTKMFGIAHKQEYVFPVSHSVSPIDSICTGTSNEQQSKVSFTENNGNVLIVDDCSNDNYSETNNIFDESFTFDSDIEPDSLMDDKVIITEDKRNKSCLVPDDSDDNDIGILYKKVLENIQIQTDFKNTEKRNFSTLTPVTEESTAKSIIDITPNEMVYLSENDEDNSKLTSLRNADELLEDNKTDSFRLPPIHKNHLSSSTSHHMNLLFPDNTDRDITKSGTVSCLNDSPRPRCSSNPKDSSPMASGEHPDINLTQETNNVHLPPITSNGHQTKSMHEKQVPQISKLFSNSLMYGEPTPEPICINEKIKELKMTAKRKPSPTKESSRASSPGSEVPERTCDLLCADLLKRLRVQTWYSVIETLESVPSSLEKFWDLISEQRIADLLRQVTSHVESPRTQVAKSACATLAIILENTNYVKKPDFYEAMSTLLNKTGSFCRPIRRAANMALDHIVCGVDLSQAVTSVCVHGSTHKSGLVRSASARLLVVCAALAHGGRSLLKSRPSTAATARQLLMRSLSAMLEDKNNDTRKFAERLYAMLRPHKDFEAYFLSDVSLEVASRQMKKYDQLITSNDIKQANQR